MVQEMRWMEGSIARRRYARRTSRTGVRRRQYNQEKKNLASVILRQGGICIVLLLIVLLAKYVDIPATRFITRNVKHVLNQNIELSEWLSRAGKSIGGFSKSIKTVNGGETVNGDLESNEGTLSTTQTSSPAQTLTTALTSDEDESLNIENTDDDAFTSEDAVETSVLAASTEDSKRHEIGMIPPVNGFVSSLFGEITNKFIGVSKPHNGIDISVTGLETIKAALDGKVNETGVSPAYGKYIRILHADGMQTVYANCSDIMVGKGDIVKQSEEIAWIGDENLSVGAHLHFEVWKDGKAIDPLDYIDVAP
jgi:murein DD-endopeptidase MepM/ murein hydrolase activator NlpD